MHIKKVLEYDYNYAQYIVTDGRNDVKCVCMSVPLPNGKKPENSVNRDFSFEKFFYYFNSLDSCSCKPV